MRDNSFDPSDPFGEKTHKPRQLEAIAFADIKPTLEGRYIIKGVFYQEQISLIVGPKQSGKTFLALDISLHIATMPEWFGRRVKNCPVIYIAVEAGRSIANRIYAWKLHHGLDDANVPFTVITSAIDLCHPNGDLDRLADTIQKSAFGEPGFIMVDTVSRALAGGDENNPGDMGAFVGSLDRLRDEFRCHVCAVHHLGKDTSRGARGHSLLVCNLDTTLDIERDDTSRISTATVTNQRDGPVGDTIAFTLRSVTLGYDEDLDPVTSCIVEAAEALAAQASQHKKALSPAQKRALKLLSDAINDKRYARAGRRQRAHSPQSSLRQRQDVA